MQGTKIIYSFWTAGALAANATITFKAPFNLTLEHVSAIQSNAGDATVAIAAGTAGTTAILAAFAAGQSNAAVTKTRSDFASTNTTGRVTKDDLVIITIDYDGASGTAGENLAIVLTCSEG
jgi:hypothetical protein